MLLAAPLAAEAQQTKVSRKRADETIQ